MEDLEPIENSLIQLLKCNVCLEQVEQLKVLSCQHTICLTCVSRFTIRNNRFRCSLCQKENHVPNGGFKQLPDSLVTKQIADLIKKRDTGSEAVNLPGSTDEQQDDSAMDTADAINNDGEPEVGVDAASCEEKLSDLKHDAEPLVTVGGGFGFVPGKKSRTLRTSESGEISSTDVSPRDKRARTSSGEAPIDKPAEDGINAKKLSRELENASRSGKNWHRRADEMIGTYAKLLDEMTEQSENAKEAIIAFQIKIDLLCKEKLKGLNKGTRERKAELEERLTSIRPQVDQMNDALKAAPDIVKRLAAKKCSAQTLEEAKQHLEKLKELNKSNSKSPQGVNDFDVIKAGQPVRVAWKNDDTEEDLDTFVKGKITHSSIGIFRGELIEEKPYLGWLQIKTRKPMVIFPEQPDWVGSVGVSVMKSLTPVALPFKGDKVRVKASVGSPHFSWNGVRAKKSRGTLTEIKHAGPDNDLFVIVNFPEDNEWRGLYSEIELVPGCGLECDDEVWVSRSIPEPSRGWAGVNGSSVGKIKRIEGAKSHEEVTVDFPECKDWIGLATELELVREPQKGEQVQVKLSVKKPDLDWGGIKHEDIGLLTKIVRDDNYGEVAQVKFAKRPPWSCLLKELEPVRYQPPNFDTSLFSGLGDSDGEDDTTVAGEAFLRMMMNAMGHMG